MDTSHSDQCEVTAERLIEVERFNNQLDVFFMRMKDAGAAAEDFIDKRFSWFDSAFGYNIRIKDVLQGDASEHMEDLHKATSELKILASSIVAHIVLGEVLLNQLIESCENGFHKSQGENAT
jgi:hypothetical protein